MVAEPGPIEHFGKSVTGSSIGTNGRSPEIRKQSAEVRAEKRLVRELFT